MQFALALSLAARRQRAAATATPANTAVPVISGIQTNGQTLSASDGGWDQPYTSNAYQWKRDGTNISGATSATYLLTGTDVGTAIAVAVTATNTFGTSTAATSAATAAIAAVVALSGTPSSTGTVGSAYSFTPTRTGGHGAYSFALTGTLPAGLSFSTFTGAITGTPTTEQVASGLNITVTDADGLSASLGSFSITVEIAVVPGGDLTMTSPTYNTTTPKFGSAALASGSGFYAGTFDNAATFAMEAWVKTTSTALIVAASAGQGMWLGASGGFAAFGHATDYEVTGTLINDGNWHHLAYVTNATTTILLIDGVWLGTKSVTPSFGANPGVYVGDHAAGGFAWVGSIDEVAFWNSTKYGGGGFTPATSAYTGTETDLAFLYHLNSNGTDSAVHGAPGDTTAPTLSSPTDAASGSTGGSLTVSTDEAGGTLYWFVSTSSTPPTATALKAGTGAVSYGNQAVIGSGVQSVTAGGLSASTAYYAHFMHRDAALNESSIVSGNGFTTDASGGGSGTIIQVNTSNWWATLGGLSGLDGEILEFTSWPDGTDLQAWAHAKAAPGITLRPKAGFEDACKVRTIFATDSQYLTFENWKVRPGTGTGTDKDRGLVTNPSSGHITARGLDIQRPDLDTFTGEAFYIYGDNHTIEDCAVSYIGTCVKQNDSSDNLTITGNSFSNIGIDGVFLTLLTNSLIDHNLFSDFHFDEGTHPDGLQFGETPDPPGGLKHSNVMVSYNRFKRGAGEAYQGMFGVSQSGVTYYRNGVSCTSSADAMPTSFSVARSDHITVDENWLKNSAFYREGCDVISFTNNHAGVITEISDPAATNDTVSGTTATGGDASTDADMQAWFDALT